MVHLTFRLPHVLHAKPVLENAAADLDGASHLLGYCKVHWKLPGGSAFPYISILYSLSLYILMSNKSGLDAG